MLKDDDGMIAVSAGPGDFPDWREMMCLNYSKTHCIRVGDAPFNGVLKRRPMGGLEVGLIRSSPLFYRRGITEIRQNPTDGFNILYLTDGEIKVAQGGAGTIVAPGDFVLYHHGSPFEIEIKKSYTATSVTVPYKLLSSRLRNATRYTAKAISGTSPNAVLACSLMKQFQQPEIFDAMGRAENVAHAMVEIIASAVEIAFGSSFEAGIPSVVSRAKDYMLHNLDNSDLDLDQIAQANAVSPRTLIRAFATEGMTPMRWLWRQRLRESFEALSSGKIESVTSAVFAFGFKDLSHFSRAFKKEFGLSPSRVLLRN